MERIIKGSDTIIEIGFGERTYGFHRDPTWPEIDAGAITVEWVNTESPLVNCYRIHAECCSAAFGPLLVFGKVFNPWTKGAIDNLKSSLINQMISHEWSETLDPNTGSLSVRSVDSIDEGNIIIKAIPISIQHSPLNGN